MSEILTMRDFSAAYGEVPVVQSLSFTVGPGEIVAVLGRNGMGKTTLLRGILGLAPVRTGTLVFAGVDTIGFAPDMMARSGIGYVPAGRGIFGSLSVRENLVMSARQSAMDPACEENNSDLQHLVEQVRRTGARWFAKADAAGPVSLRPHFPRPPRSGSEAETGTWTLERVLSLFPRLAERMSHGGQNLSGGEQQMLAIGRALMTNPRLLLIDEATEGLAPLVARDIWRTLGEICRTGVAALIVDRDVRQLAGIASRAIVLFKGKIVVDGPPEALLRDENLMQRYIGL